MPTITTQSIGAVGAPLVTSPISSQAARATQVSVSAGVQKNQNQARASASATDAKPTNKRTIQDEARTEGVFGEEESGGQEPDSDSEAAKNPPGSFSRLA
jgi:hypothetical protein